MTTYRHFIAFLLLLALLIGLPACGQKKDSGQTMVFEGLTLSSGTCLITWTDGNDLIKDLDLISLSLPEGENRPAAGTLVRYTIGQEIMESYPPQAWALSLEILADKAGPVKISMETAMRIREHQPDRTVLLDVRTPEEFDDGHLPDAINYPLALLRKEPPSYSKEDTLIIYCRSGNRTIEASRLLDEAGFVLVLDAGGILSFTG
ncbi:MAG: rhodanese-like domain-containing protein [Clostridiaceae bacterium]|jgi:phage shock protein E|nr:rhodanese-like domain-containing protein [Clostridiaceae bacterium]